MSGRSSGNGSRFEEKWSVPLAFAYVGVLLFVISVLLGNVLLFMASIVIMWSGSIVHINTHGRMSAGSPRSIDRPASR